MTFLRRLFKNPALIAAALIMLAAPSGAASFKFSRGINLDQWVTWPGESTWGQPGVLDPFPEWRRFISPDQLRQLKADGFDFVRVPVDPLVFMSRESAGQRSALLASLVESLTMINDAGLNAIVDLHLIEAGSGRSVGSRQVLDDEAVFERYLDVVRLVAGAVSSFDPAKVAFEPMNEPVTECEGNAPHLWGEYMRRLFAAARASATRLTIVLSGGCWSDAKALAVLDPKSVPDDNVVWTFHSYSPFLLTSQGATWAGDFIRYVTGLPYPLDNIPRSELDARLDRIKARMRREAPLHRRLGHVAYLDTLVGEIDTSEKLRARIEEPFAVVSAWAKANGIAPSDILLGEFGMIRQEYGQDFVMPPATRAAYYRDVIGIAERHGFGWSMWSYSGAFGLVDEFDGRKAETAVIDMVRSLPPRPDR